MINWAKKEGWNPGKYDLKTFYHTDSQGFFIGKLNNESIGCISAISYDEYFGFLGFYIVKSDFRGKGYGIQLWRHALSHLKERNIGLDGVVAQ
ncbi:GNAT family N-acetyltransferase [Geminocystis sp. CENA526]|uniref:GNAT family N-acetyltransferase n=1 Tax=Geminocystis sp. CENA526 TaxID=1355871 RepID=UPI003D6EC3BA